MNKAKAKQGRFTVILRAEREGGYSVQCLELPGAISEGETKEQTFGTLSRDILKRFLKNQNEPDRFGFRVS